MINFKLKEISKCVNGYLIGDSNIVINSISINSKKIYTKNCLFIAFKGKKFDSHIFINEAISNGAIAIIIKKNFKLNNNICCNKILVKNTNNSLYKICKLIREKSKSFFISITGSCGKTTIKEILKNILVYSNNKISYTYKNNNNIVGVMLTMIEINLNDKFVIIELGMDNLGQILNSVKLVKPNLILINNISISHTNKVKSFENIIKSKGEIFYGLKNNGKIILNYFNNYWDNIWKFYFCNINKQIMFFSCLYSKYSFCYATNIKLYKLNSKFIVNTPYGSFYTNLNLPGLHNISNFIASVSILINLKINIKTIKKHAKKISSVKQRLYPIFLSKNKIILDDTYNSSLESVINSIKVLSKFNGYKLLIIGNIVDLGNISRNIHFKISKIIKNFNINKIISIDNLSKIITKKLKNSVYINNESFLIRKILSIINKKNKISILFKASRSVGLDKILKKILKIYKK